MDLPPTAYQREYALSHLTQAEGLRYGADGGSADRVYPVLTDDNLPGVVKLYKPGQSRRLDSGSVLFLCDWVRRQSDPVVLAHCAWPVSMIRDQSKIVGYLMRPTPARYLHGPAVTPLDFGLVVESRADCAKATPTAHPYYETPQKLARLGDLLALIVKLHESGVVVGDLTQSNTLTTGPYERRHLDSVPDILLIDADSFVIKGRSVLPRMDPPLFDCSDEPWNPPQFDERTDFFKFGVLACCCVMESYTITGAEVELEKWVPERDVRTIASFLRGETPLVEPAQLKSMANSWSHMDWAGQLRRRSASLPVRHVPSRKLVSEETWRVAQRQLLAAPESATPASHATTGQALAKCLGAPPVRRQRRWALAATVVVGLVLVALVVVAVLSFAS
ncbi:MAG: hypothetical protein LBS56_00605 [Propionibacteriaceae bacterium]|nr:hypothetical protein [Propionibacteriaceae bacterium]